MTVYNGKAINHPFKLLIWNRSRDFFIVLWIDSNKDTNKYLAFFNTIDTSSKISLTYQTKNENDLEFLDSNKNL